MTTWLTRAFLLIILLSSTAGAQQPYGPDTCVSGYVWREAFAGDHVCVAPPVRAQAAADNQQASARRVPGGGPYGPDTCRQGFVWREARPTDRVCVSPETRTQAANDNKAAASRVAGAQIAARAGRLAAASAAGRGVTAAGRGIVLQPPALGQPIPPRPTSGATTRGFDDKGDPYIEDVMPDGSKRREQRNGVTIIAPDGTPHFIPYSFTNANAPAPTPPQLPESGMAWVNYHNRQLLDLISAMVNQNAEQMDRFHSGENAKVGSDPFKQIGYRMQVLDQLAKP